LEKKRYTAASLSKKTLCFEIFEKIKKRKKKGKKKKTLHGCQLVKKSAICLIKKKNEKKGTLHGCQLVKRNRYLL